MYNIEVLYAEFKHIFIIDFVIIFHRFDNDVLITFSANILFYFVQVVFE